MAAIAQASRGVSLETGEKMVIDSPKRLQLCSDSSGGPSEYGKVKSEGCAANAAGQGREGDASCAGRGGRSDGSSGEESEGRGRQVKSETRWAATAGPNARTRKRHHEKRQYGPDTKRVCYFYTCAPCGLSPSYCAVRAVKILGACAGGLRGGCPFGFFRGPLPGPLPPPLFLWKRDRKLPWAGQEISVDIGQLGEHPAVWYLVF